MLPPRRPRGPLLKNPSGSIGTSQRFPLRRSLKVAQSLPTVPSEEAREDELITPEQSADFDFREIQHRYLMALTNDAQNDGTSS